jgi:hypothetical protein
MSDLGQIDPAARTRRRLTIVRLLLPLSWLLAAVGTYGPWIAHKTAALTLSGVDMAEFVKFLPGVLDGSLVVNRLLFYLPPLAIVVSVALLAGSHRLRFAWPLRLAMVLLAVPVSLQLLPPAWSPASLGTAEFRLQTLGLAACWLLLATFWLWGRLPAWLAGSLSAALALAAAAASTWQFLVVKPAIDVLYGQPPATGWGFFLCQVGLVAIVVAGATLVARILAPGERLWSGE